MKKIKILSTLLALTLMISGCESETERAERIAHNRAVQMELAKNGIDNRRQNVQYDYNGIPIEQQVLHAPTTMCGYNEFVRMNPNYYVGNLQCGYWKYDPLSGRNVWVYHQRYSNLGASTLSSALNAAATAIIFKSAFDSYSPGGWSDDSYSRNPQKTKIVNKTTIVNNYGSKDSKSTTQSTPTGKKVGSLSLNKNKQVSSNGKKVGSLTLDKKPKPVAAKPKKKSQAQILEDQYQERKRKKEAERQKRLEADRAERKKVYGARPTYSGNSSSLKKKKKKKFQIFRSSKKKKRR